MDMTYIYILHSTYILDIGGWLWLMVLMVYIMVVMANIRWIWILTGSNGIYNIYIYT